MVEPASIDTSWKGLAKMGGAALLIDGILIFALYALGPNVPPADATQYLKTFATSGANLARTGIFTVAAILFAPGILGLYGALKQANRAWMLTATGLVFVGIGIWFVDIIGNVASIQLANSYASASSAQQASYVAAAQATIALTNTADILVGTVVSVGLVLIGLAMLKGMLGKRLAYLTLLAGVIGLVGSVPGLIFLMAVFFLLYAIWFVWAGFKLWRMS